MFFVSQYRTIKMRFSLLIGFMFLSLLLGCDSGPAIAHVSGQVTMDGTPVEMGQIFFEPIGGDSTIGTGIIADGEFEVVCPPGNYKVVITGTRKIPGAKPISNIPGEEIDARESIIPEKYNRQTTLTKEVQQGEQSVNFHLEK
ncbi:hypothetical protein [Bremerella sp. P1]|uniref:hypothetical protein n=1 Tax=Bremerella sp. P1 TaxID=3026424 RepID=UPI002367F0B5|nr:hypothetical protein [Bremerella sp. P1]WDI41689.1 hypothetical protein PSR63_24830 [Bremerella sp. P1]